MAGRASPMAAMAAPILSSFTAVATSFSSFLQPSSPPRLRPNSTPSSFPSRRLSFSLSNCDRPLRRTRPGRCQVVGEGSQPSFNDDRTVYKGVYGPWTVEPSDVREVILYRSGLVTAAASFVIASSAAYVPDGNIVGDIIKKNIDLLYTTGAGGLGLSLLLIHIYVTPIKRALQALWVIGLLGSIGTYLTLAQPLNESLVEYVIDNPISLWFVGPLFAALTGLVFKEGLCYGKLEAGFLTFIIPGLLLGHLTGLLDNGAKLSLLGVWMALFVVFATRKFQQPIKDDIGDKSVFMFNALAEDEKRALIQKLEQQVD